MKKLLLLSGILGLLLVPAKTKLLAVEVGGYGWYLGFDGGEGYGAGVVVREDLLEFLMVDFRTGYFESINPITYMIPVEGSVLARIPFPVVSPYAGLGLGYYNFIGGGTDVDSVFGYFGTLGAEASLGDWKVFFEGRYQLLEPEAQSTGFSYTKGEKVDLSGFGLALGVTYTF